MSVIVFDLVEIILISEPAFTFYTWSLFWLARFFTNEAVPLFRDFIKGMKETCLTEVRRGRYLRGRRGTKM